MNRNQRVLTIIALIAFVVIGALHYLGWPPMEFHDSHQRAATPKEEKQRRKEYVQRYDEKSAKAADTIGYFKTVVYQEWHPHLMLDDPAIPDARVPWFMLSVTYVGLFFLLANKRGSNEPTNTGRKAFRSRRMIVRVRIRSALNSHSSAILCAGHNAALPPNLVALSAILLASVRGGLAFFGEADPPHGRGVLRGAKVGNGVAVGAGVAVGVATCACAPAKKATKPTRTHTLTKAIPHRIRVLAAGCRS